MGGGLPSFNTSRDTSADSYLPPNLAQSCKPAAVGMFAQGGRVNICILENALRKNKDGWQTITLRKVPPQWQWGEDVGGVHSEQESKLVF